MADSQRFLLGLALMSALLLGQTGLAQGSSPAESSAGCSPSGPYVLTEVTSDFASLLPSVRKHLAGVGRVAFAKGCLPRLTCIAATKERADRLVVRKFCAVAARALAVAVPKGPTRTAAQKSIAVTTDVNDEKSDESYAPGTVLMWLVPGEIDLSKATPTKVKPSTLTRR